jgi:hypothetical protein
VAAKTQPDVQLCRVSKIDAHATSLDAQAQSTHAD